MQSCTQSSMQPTVGTAPLARIREVRSLRRCEARGSARHGAALGRPGLRLRELVRRPDVPDPEDAASRVSAYVYGNVLVMAVLISLQPEDLQGATGVLSVLGVGLSTAVAHLVGQAAGCRIRHRRSAAAAVLKWQLTH